MSYTRCITVPGSLCLSQWISLGMSYTRKVGQWVKLLTSRAGEYVGVSANVHESEDEWVNKWRMSEFNTRVRNFHVMAKCWFSFFMNFVVRYVIDIPTCVSIYSWLSCSPVFLYQFTIVTFIYSSIVFSFVSFCSLILGMLIQILDNNEFVETNRQSYSYEDCMRYLHNPEHVVIYGYIGQHVEYNKTGLLCNTVHQNSRGVWPSLWLQLKILETSNILNVESSGYSTATSWHWCLMATSYANCWYDAANHVTRLWLAGDTGNFEHRITG